MTRFDFIVIGSGPAGRRAAIQAAKSGHSVLVVEKGQRVGGVSVSLSEILCARHTPLKGGRDAEPRETSRTGCEEAAHDPA